MFIRANGGWDNWTMILVDYKPCATKLELHKIEREYIENIDSNLLLNKLIPSRTKKESSKEYRETNKEYYKEYYEANKDKLTEYKKKYNDDNKDKLNEKQREKIVCDKCGKLSMRSNIKRHQQGNRCIKI
tara:strand:+ start:340 stop:729 length:390 start_codon:yes stop_codon:yes gene_type:complete